MTEERRTSAMGPALIVGAALLAAALLGVTLAPMVPCLACEGTGRFRWQDDMPESPCPFCRETGKVTLYQRYVARIFALEEPASPGKTPRP